jgi:hypothetical protein
MLTGIINNKIQKDKKRKKAGRKEVLVKVTVNWYYNYNVIYVDKYFYPYFFYKLFTIVLIIAFKDLTHLKYSQPLMNKPKVDVKGIYTKQTLNVLRLITLSSKNVYF